RLVKLSMDLHVAMSTLYKWREDAVDLTLYGAIEAGALRPYGIAPMQPDAARAEAGGAQGSAERGTRAGRRLAHPSGGWARRATRHTEPASGRDRTAQWMRTRAQGDAADRTRGALG